MLECGTSFVSLDEVGDEESEVDVNAQWPATWAPLPTCSDDCQGCYDCVVGDDVHPFGGEDPPPGYYDEVEVEVELVQSDAISNASSLEEIEIA